MGIISLAEWIQASEDADAMRQAQLFQPGALKREVWQGQRLVASLEAKHLQA